MQVRFVHAADLHLDRPFSGLRGANDEVRERLRDATHRALDRVVATCLEEHADFAVFAGDIFDGDQPTLRAQVAFTKAVARLAEVRIPSFIGHGNHDSWSDWSQDLNWPDLAHRFSSDEVEHFPVTRDGQLLCQVYGTSFATRHVSENLALRYRRDDDAPLAVAVLHTDVSGTDGYAPCSLSDLGPDFDYWALGHIHGPEVLRPADPCVVYAGCPQGLDPTEHGPRGCFLVTLEEGADPHTDFVTTSPIEWGQASISIDGLDRDGDLLSRIEDQVEEIRTRAQCEMLIARITLTGAGPLHALARGAESEGGMLETVREPLWHGTPLVWVESIRDETRPEIDVEAHLDDKGFVGEFLRGAVEATESTEELAALREELTPLLDRREVRQAATVSDADLRRWLALARNVGAEQLLRERVE